MGEALMSGGAGGSGTIYKWKRYELNSTTKYTWNKWNLNSTTTYKWNKWNVESDTLNCIYASKNGSKYGWYIQTAGVTTGFWTSYILTGSGAIDNHVFKGTGSKVAVNDVTVGVYYIYGSGSYDVKEVRSGSVANGFYGSLLAIPTRGSSYEVYEHVQVPVYGSEKKGTTSYGQVTSTSSSAYPSNGVSGSYWYESAGSSISYSKGSYVGTVSSSSSSAYPNGSYSGSYWYDGRTSSTVYSQGAAAGIVYNTNRNAYPDNSYTGSYWYVFDGEA